MRVLDLKELDEVSGGSGCKPAKTRCGSWGKGSGKGSSKGSGKGSNKGSGKGSNKCSGKDSGKGSGKGSGNNCKPCLITVP